MDTTRLITLFILMLSACGQSVGKDIKWDGPSLQGVPSSNQRAEAASAPASDEFQRPSDCRTHIAKIICLVDPDRVSLENNQLPDNSRMRPCLPGSERFAPSFEAIHDQFPPFMQKMFCSLKKIYIE